ncbi:Clavaminate synthase-like protein [Cylindrobasidium torrendii FP15055 ss-10]|uniref:Clavaminate synthase-like protein n=1 Tax=Cylindrobasidium torrendii FP15055 ss-10 TaxID=1314674 RepID=A0A0D7BLJ4_9AGAR|nr:Clavaminate synthase-like protein [Cylindrobasidium torrendii FP15055 ss-10]
MSTYQHYLPALKWISREYRDLNSSHYKTLENPPSALEFSRIVLVSRPVLVKSSHLDANKDLWTDEYLAEKMNTRIAHPMLLYSFADAIAVGPDGAEYFVEPHVEMLTMPELLNRLNGQDGSNENTEAFYLQSQNGNLYSSEDFEGGKSPSEFDVLRQDVPADISWFSAALGRHPDAVNLWIGNSGSTTSIHSDPYENLYHVVRGEKYFTLLPPTEGWCLKERVYPHAAYIRDEVTGKLIIKPSLSDNTPTVRWSSISDPNIPGAFDEEPHRINITVRAGETLYLPAGWWHYVQQSEETTIALNWWYDIEMQGASWVMLGLFRGAGELPAMTAE